MGACVGGWTCTILGYSQEKIRICQALLSSTYNENDEAKDGIDSETWYYGLIEAFKETADSQVNAYIPVGSTLNWGGPGEIQLAVMDDFFGDHFGMEEELNSDGWFTYIGSVDAAKVAESLRSSIYFLKTELPNEIEEHPELIPELQSLVDYLINLNLDSVANSLIFIAEAD